MIDLAPHHLETVRSVLRAHVVDCEVRAFGSRVTGHAKPHSDLDLAIMAEHPQPWQTLARLREAFEESDLPITVDVVDWAAATEAFRRSAAQPMEIVQHGRLPNAPHR